MNLAELTEFFHMFLARVALAEVAVQDRFIKEITYWYHRAEALKRQEQAGKANACLNSGETRKRADKQCSP